MTMYENSHSLPESLVFSLTRNEYHNPADYSVTEICGPVQLGVLRKRYAENLKKEASDNLMAMIGNAVHSMLETGAEGVGSIAEERLTAQFRIGKDTVTLGGAIDEQTEDGIIRDWKTTSVYSVRNGGKEDWHNQLNGYATLVRMVKNTSPLGLEVGAILRDWSIGATKRTKDYPRIAYQTVKIPMWPEGEAYDYVVNRLTKHHTMRNVDRKELPQCTMEEKWQDPTKYAVMKKGRKSAIRVFDTIGEANARAKKETEKSTAIYIEERPSVPRRCENYCEVSDFCYQYETEG